MKAGGPCCSARSLTSELAANIGLSVGLNSGLSVGHSTGCGRGRGCGLSDANESALLRLSL
jgi:hypothetical protein